MNLKNDSDNGAAEIITITARELKTKMEENPKLTVVNVLAKDVYEDCSIKGSINIPLNELEKQVSNWDKNKEIIVYCAHSQCPASKKGYNILTNMGFKNITAYEGGMREWKNKNYPSVGACKLEYLSE